MKQELKDIAAGAAQQVPGVAGYLATGQLVIMVLTVLLLIIQICYYLSKWWREESPWGQRMRRWVDRKRAHAGMQSKPMELDE